MMNKKFVITTTLFLAVVFSLLFLKHFLPLTQPTVPNYLEQYLIQSTKNKNIWIVTKVSNVYTIENTNDNSVFILANPNQINASYLEGKKIIIDGNFLLSHQASERIAKDVSAIVLNVTSIEIVN